MDKTLDIQKRFVENNENLMNLVKDIGKERIENWLLHCVSNINCCDCIAHSLCMEPSYKHLDCSATIKLILSELYSNNNWILLAERVPDVTGYYYVTFLYKGELKVFTCKFDKSKNIWHLPTDKACVVCPVAWHERPEPWKAE